VFVLRLSSIDVEGLDIELFMYHIFKVFFSIASLSLFSIDMLCRH